MKFNARGVFIIVFLLFLVSCKESEQRLVVEQFGRGIEYYENGDYEQAYKIFIPLAESGHRGAQNNLGVLYSKGKYVDKDLEKAFYWFHKSAENGNANAMQNVAGMYLRGDGVVKSCSNAVDYYINGHNSENIKSTYTLGSLYSRGECVSKNIVKSAEYFSEAASTESEYGKLAQAMMHYKGIGIGKDFKKAFDILVLLNNDWNNQEVQFYLATMYYYGEGAEKNYDKALSFYKKALESGSKESGYSIGYMAYYKQAEIDPVEAFNILLANSKSGHKRSQKLLSVFYKEGFGVDKDVEKAAYWKQQSKEQ